MLEDEEQFIANFLMGIVFLVVLILLTIALW